MLFHDVIFAAVCFAFYSSGNTFTLIFSLVFLFLSYFIISYMCYFVYLLYEPLLYQLSMIYVKHNDIVRIYKRNFTEIILLKINFLIQKKSFFTCFFTSGLKFLHPSK